MGTRGLTCVYANGDFKIAQYGQWDHYPSGAGQIVYDFIQSKLANSPSGCQKFLEQISKTWQPTEEEIKQWYIDCGADGESEWITSDISDKFKELQPSLNRDMGANILDFIFENSHVPLKIDTDFAAQSLFCEWVYILDMDKKVLEVYEGFNKHPLIETERFYYLTEMKEGEYYPVSFKASFPFDKMPSFDNFLETFEESDE